MWLFKKKKQKVETFEEPKEETLRNEVIVETIVETFQELKEKTLRDKVLDKIEKLKANGFKGDLAIKILLENGELDQWIKEEELLCLNRFFYGTSIPIEELNRRGNINDFICFFDKRIISGNELIKKIRSLPLKEVDNYFEIIIVLSNLISTDHYYKNHGTKKIDDGYYKGLVKVTKNTADIALDNFKFLSYADEWTSFHDKIKSLENNLDFYYSIRRYIEDKILKELEEYESFNLSEKKLVWIYENVAGLKLKELIVKKIIELK